MRPIDADKAIEVAQIKYNDWNLAMAAADGQRQINLCFKKQELFKAVKSVLDCVPTLTPPTQEQMERVFGGEWEEERFAGELEGWMHIECGRHSTEKTPFCPKCGKAMTQEALEITKKRWEALNDE